MSPTQFSLLEQMRITDFDVESRKALLNLTSEDLASLEAARHAVHEHLDELVDRFYTHQTQTPEIEALIGDADTLRRLRVAQRRYIQDLFSGRIGLDYVNDRLRIGLVHKRIGVEPKLYLSAVHEMRRLLIGVLETRYPELSERVPVLAALDKLIFFDVTLVFETYVQSMVSTIEAERKKTEQYARVLEEKVHLRTDQLRTDPLTGLINRRFLEETLERALRAAQRRNEPLCLAFMDLDRFKVINDEQGHARGDEILRGLGQILLEVVRSEDSGIRYGGDEFCVILSNCNYEQAQQTFCNRVTALLDEQLPGVSLSIGVAQTGPGEYANPSDLLAEADSRMYARKQAKKAMAATGISASALVIPSEQDQALKPRPDAH